MSGRREATFSSIIAKHARWGETAVLGDSCRWSYAELLGRAARFGERLRACGATRGDVVPALLSTTAEALAVVLSGCRTGCPVAPLPPRATVDELAACVDRLPARLLVSDPEWERIARRLARHTGLELEIVSDLEPGDSEPLPASSGSDVVAILHTSGTTGRPKQVPITEERLAQRARANAGLLGLDRTCVYATASPFHHIAGLGMLFVALGAGSAVVPFPRFSIDAWKDLARVGTTHALLVPTMIHQLLESGTLPIASLRLLQYGGSPIDPGLLARALATLPHTRFVQIFGQTEGSPITCLTHQDHERAVAGETGLLASVGRPVDCVELAIEGPDSAGVGEVCARGEHLFVRDADGWLRTGDLGRVDDEGYLYLLGRKGDKIIRGGENVFPLEVERILESHPEVKHAAVVGVPDSRLGESIRAFLVLERPEAAPTQEEVRAHCREKLAGFKIPAEWFIVEELPRNAAGKILRRELAGITAPPRRLPIGGATHTGGEDQ